MQPDKTIQSCASACQQYSHIPITRLDDSLHDISRPCTAPPGQCHMYMSNRAIGPSPSHLVNSIRCLPIYDVYNPMHMDHMYTSGMRQRPDVFVSHLHGSGIPGPCQSNSVMPQTRSGTDSDTEPRLCLPTRHRCGLQLQREVRKCPARGICKLCGRA